MAQAQEAGKHVIWSNINLDLDDWKPDLEEYYPDRTEEEYYGLMQEINDSYLDDERANLDIQLSMPIIACADLGLWNGRRTGYRMIESGNIRDCLAGGGDYSEWFVDRRGDLRCTAIHHDGTNHYLYRAVRERVPDWRVERLQEKLYNGTADEADIERVTRRLGDEIAAVYGFPIPEKEKGGPEEMETVDVRKEILEEVELFGRTGYFTELRVDRGTVPEGLHCYELRHGDDGGIPVSVEENVRVNYFGAVLLAEALDLGEGKALQVGCGDFGYTGLQMYLSQAVREWGPGKFQDGKALAGFSQGMFPMTEQEAQKLLGYMEGHHYFLGHMGGELFRGDFGHGQGGVRWEPYTMDDAVNDAADRNFELLKEAEAALQDTGDGIDPADKKSRLDSLREDERILDGMFDRTKHGKEIGAAAAALAGQMIQSLRSKGDIDGAVKELAQGIKGGQEWRG